MSMFAELSRKRLKLSQNAEITWGKNKYRSLKKTAEKSLK